MHQVDVCLEGMQLQFLTTSISTTSVYSLWLCATLTSKRPSQF